MLRRRFKLIKQGLDDGAVLNDLNDVSSSGATNGQIILWNGTAWVPGNWSDIAGYTAEANNLTVAVTWANVPDANITQTSVTQHQAALTLTASQISDFTEVAQDAAGAMAALTGVGVDLVYDDGAGTLVANLDIPNLTAEATVDGAADYVIMYDNSAAAVRKVLIDNLPSGGASPLTTKGDVYTYSTVDARLAVGTNGQVLSADSAEATGLKWITNTPSLPLTTKGDILGYDTAAARVPIGTDGQVLTADSAQTLGLKWAAASGAAGIPNTDPGKYYQWVDDFVRNRMSATGSTDDGWDIGTNGAGSTIQALHSEAESGHPGIVSSRLQNAVGAWLSAGYAQNNNSIAEYSNNAANIMLGGGEIEFHAVLKLMQTANGGYNATWWCLVGMAYSTSGLWPATSTLPTHGIYFDLYSDSGTVRWVGRVRSAASESTTTLTSGAAATTNWVHLKFVVNAGATSIEFFVDGSSIGTVTTNIPSGTYYFIPGWSMRNILAPSADNHMRMDLMEVRQTMTTTRYT